jgi:uncharacterized membrane protein
MQDLIKRNNHYLILFAFIIIGFFLRLYHINAVSIDTDEAWAPFYASQSLDLPTLKGIALNESHPPFYYIILHFWFKLFKGDEVLAAKYFSLLNGLLSILLIYIVGQNLFDRKVGIVSAFIVTLSPFHIYYSQYARDYTFICFVVLLSTICFLKCLDEDSWYWEIGYILSTLTCFYTHYFSIIVVFGQYAFLFLFFGKYRNFILKRWSIYQIIIFIFSLPLLYILSTQMVTANEVLMSLSDRFESDSIIYVLYKIAYTIIHIFNLGHSSAPPIYIENIFLYRVSHKIIFMAGLLVFCIPFIKGIKDINKSEKTLFCTIYLLIPIFIMTFVWMLFPYLWKPKYVIFVSFGYYLLIARGLISYSRKVSFGINCTMILILSLFSISNLFIFKQYMRADLKGALEFVASDFSKNEDILIFYPRDYQMAVDYYNKSMGLTIESFPARLDPMVDFRKDNFPTKDNVHFISKITEGYDNIWLIVCSPEISSSKLLINWMKDKYNLTKEKAGFYLGPPLSVPLVYVGKFNNHKIL